MNKKLTKNTIRCNHCGDTITSEYTHDFRWCKCGTVAVDGGLSYAKRCFKNSPNDYADLSEWEEIREEPTEEKAIEVDYTIVSAPSYIVFECPYCHEKAKVPFKDVDYNTDYWGDGGWAECSKCGLTVALGDWEYD